MPAYYVGKLQEVLGGLRGKHVLVLGVSYREKVKEVAFSGAYDVLNSLQDRGAIPLFLDPLYTIDELNELGFQPFESGMEDKIEGLILHTSHLEFKLIKMEIFTNLRAIVDGRFFFSSSEILKKSSFSLNQPKKEHRKS
jgi:UDP-N-acetyl-D-mannosaminuronate dehydrogenase